MGYCIICKKHSDGTTDGRSFHGFPSNELMKNKWMNSLNLTSVKKHDRVCSEHFAPSSFKQTFGLGQKARLNDKAVPQIQICPVESSESEGNIYSPSDKSGDDNGCFKAEVDNAPFEAKVDNPSFKIEIDDTSFKTETDDTSFDRKDVDAPFTLQTDPLISDDATKRISEDDGLPNVKRYRVLQKSNEYLSAEDFASSKAWTRFRKHMKALKQERAAARMRLARAKSTKKKMSELIKKLVANNQEILSSHLPVVDL